MELDSAVHIHYYLNVLQYNYLFHPLTERDLMKKLKVLKNILKSANKKVSTNTKIDSGKIRIKLVDPNRLGCYPYL